MGPHMAPMIETIRLSTEIPRPRHEVWRAFADTESRQLWGVPKGEALVYDRDDLRTGGRAEYRCGTPEELQFRVEVSYVAVEESSFVVNTETVWHGDDLLATGLITWTFSDVSGGTRLSIDDQLVSFVGTDMIEGSRNGHRIVLDQLTVSLAEGSLG